MNAPNIQPATQPDNITGIAMMNQMEIAKERSGSGAALNIVSVVVVSGFMG